MTEEQNKDVQSYTLEEILANASKGDYVDIYANHAQFVVTDNEIVIDLFKLSPENKPENQPQVDAVRVQRILLPHSLGKGFVNALANAIVMYEENSGNHLPNNRGRRDTDKVNVWKE